MSASTATPTSPEVLRGVVGRQRWRMGDEIISTRHDYGLFRADPRNLKDDIKERSALTFGESTLGVVALRSNTSPEEESLGGVALLKRTDDPSVNEIEVDITDDHSGRSDIIKLMIREVEQGVEPGNIAQITACGTYLRRAARDAGYVIGGEQPGAGQPETVVLQKQITSDRSPVSILPPTH